MSCQRKYLDSCSWPLSLRTIHYIYIHSPCHYASLMIPHVRLWPLWQVHPAFPYRQGGSGKGFAKPVPSLNSCPARAPTRVVDAETLRLLVDYGRAHHVGSWALAGFQLRAVDQSKSWWTIQQRQGSPHMHHGNQTLCAMESKHVRVREFCEDCVLMYTYAYMSYHCK